MAAIGATVSAEDLSLAGITGDMATALVGLTWSEARTKLAVIVSLVSANTAISRDGVQSYSINGKTVTASIQQLKDALAVVNAGLSLVGNGGGPLFIGVDL
jgi:hypothetical protein